MRRRGALAYGLGALSLSAACAGTARPSATPRPLGEDLVALVPSGAGVVLEVDVEQLRVWPEGRRLFQLVPAAGRAQLLALGFDPLSDVDAVTLAVAEAGTERSATTVIVRGDLALDRVAQGLGATRDGEYHGASLYEGDTRGVAQLGPRLYAFGSAVDLRRAIDLSRGEGESLRTSRADAPLREALDRAPTAKVGRPAIRGAALITEPLAAALRKGELPADEWRWLAGSVAIGDGFDVGAVVDLPGPAESADLVKAGKRALAELAARPLVRLLGLRALFDPVVLVARQGEVHLAYRVGGERLAGVLSRLESFAPARGEGQTGAGERSR
jgi:hypothetical protein